MVLSITTGLLLCRSLYTSLIQHVTSCHLSVHGWKRRLSNHLLTTLKDLMSSWVTSQVEPATVPGFTTCSRDTLVECNYTITGNSRTCKSMDKQNLLLFHYKTTTYQRPLSPVHLTSLPILRTLHGWESRSMTRWSFTTNIHSVTWASLSPRTCPGSPTMSSQWSTSTRQMCFKIRKPSSSSESHRDIE